MQIPALALWFRGSPAGSGSLFVTGSSGDSDGNCSPPATRTCLLLLCCLPPLGRGPGLLPRRSSRAGSKVPSATPSTTALVPFSTLTLEPGPRCPSAWICPRPQTTCSSPSAGGQPRPSSLDLSAFLSARVRSTWAVRPASLRQHGNDSHSGRKVRGHSSCTASLKLF